MTQGTLSKRLSAIANLIPEIGGVADVGTDHGHIPLWLHKKGHKGKIFASDINSGPLDKARAYAHEHGASKDICFLLCDGLEDIPPDEVKTVVIAGMGGETIAGILSFAPWTRKEGRRLILQPMTKSEELRLWLFENGYKVLSEQLVEDGKVYEILTACGGGDLPYTAAELLTGHTDLIKSDRLYPKQLQLLISKLDRACKGIKSSSKENDAGRLEELLETLRQLLEMNKLIGGNHGKG